LEIPLKKYDFTQLKCHSSIFIPQLDLEIPQISMAGNGRIISKRPGIHRKVMRKSHRKTPSFRSIKSNINGGFNGYDSGKSEKHD